MYYAVGSLRTEDLFNEYLAFWALLARSCLAITYEYHVQEDIP